MFATDPTLYGATIQNRDFTYMNPYFAQFQQFWSPWMQYGQQFPWMHGKYLPFGEFGGRYMQQVPFVGYGQGFHNLPQYRWQFPFGY